MGIRACRCGSPTQPSLDRPTASEPGRLPESARARGATLHDRPGAHAPTRRRTGFVRERHASPAGEPPSTLNPRVFHPHTGRVKPAVPRHGKIARGSTHPIGDRLDGVPDDSRRGAKRAAKPTVRRCIFPNFARLLASLPPGLRRSEDRRKPLCGRGFESLSASGRGSREPTAGKKLKISRGDGRTFFAVRRIKVRPENWEWGKEVPGRPPDMQGTGRQPKEGGRWIRTTSSPRRTGRSDRSRRALAAGGFRPPDAARPPIEMA